MAWNYNSGDEADKSLVYDLRQIYAKDILGETLKAIKFARTHEMYPQWYHLLKRDLLTEISQKLTEKELISIKITIDNVKKILHDHGNAFIGKNKNADEHEIIEDALCLLEMAMTRLMEDHNMYGYVEDDEGL